jgi:hypothetical protein
MRDYRMHDPEAQCDALAVRISKELKDLLVEPPRVELLRSPPEEGLCTFFEIDYPVSHRLHGEMRLGGRRAVELDLWVDGEAELPAGLELFASLSWAPSEPVGLVLGQYGFEGPEEDVEPLNGDRELRELIPKVLRGVWERGDVTVEHPEPLLEIVPNPPILHASTLPRNAWLGLAQELGLVPFLLIAARVEELHE